MKPHPRWGAALANPFECYHMFQSAQLTNSAEKTRNSEGVRNASSCDSIERIIRKTNFPNFPVDSFEGVDKMTNASRDPIGPRLAFQAAFRLLRTETRYLSNGQCNCGSCHRIVKRWMHHVSQRNETNILHPVRPAPTGAELPTAHCRHQATWQHLGETTRILLRHRYNDDLSSDSRFAYDPSGSQRQTARYPDWSGLGLPQPPQRGLGLVQSERRLVTRSTGKVRGSRALPQFFQPCK